MSDLILRMVVIGVGAVATVLCIAAQSFKSAPTLFEIVIQIAGLASAVVIPVILLLTAKVRGLVEKPR